MDDNQVQILKNCQHYGKTIYFWNQRVLRFRNLERELSSFIFDLKSYAECGGVNCPLDSPNLRLYCSQLRRHLLGKIGLYFENH